MDQIEQQQFPLEGPVSVKQVADYVGITPVALCRQVKAGRFPSFFWLCGKRTFLSEDIRAYVLKASKGR
jgi:predicted site-specific integrase-resolvase